MGAVALFSSEFFTDQNRRGYAVFCPSRRLKGRSWNFSPTAQHSCDYKRLRLRGPAPPVRATEKAPTCGACPARVSGRDQSSVSSVSSAFGFGSGFGLG